VKIAFCCTVVFELDVYAAHHVEAGDDTVVVPGGLADVQCTFGEELCAVIVILNNVDLRKIVEADRMIGRLRLAWE
jgi:hypothetical protein